MKNSSIRMALDGALTVLLIVSMLAQLTGVIAHEIIGVVFLFAVVAHMASSFKWMKTVASLVENAQVKEGPLAFFAVAVLLGITFAVLAISSVPISRLLYHVGLAPKVMSSMWLSVHKVSAFLLCILAVTHLAMHWASILRHLNIPYDPSKRKTIGMGVKVISCAGIAALGVIGFNSLELFAGAGENAAASTARTDSSTGATSLSQPNGQAGASDSSESGLSATEAGSDPIGNGSSSDVTGGQTSSQSSSKSDSSDTQIDGTCPLCHKHCPLSDPQCDKPYRAGLIAS